jgi:hypothetical protein
MGAGDKDRRVLATIALDHRDHQRLDACAIIHVEIARTFLKWSSAKEMPPMLNMKPTAPTENTDVTVVCAALTPPDKPAALVLAENVLAAARKRRAEISAELSTETRVHRETGGSNGAPNRPSRAMVRLQAEIDQIDKTITQARDVLAQRRADYQPRLNAIVHGARAHVEAALLPSLVDMEAVLKALVEIGSFAERNGMAAPRPATGSRTALECLTEVRRRLGLPR